MNKILPKIIPSMRSGDLVLCTDTMKYLKMLWPNGIIFFYYKVPTSSTFTQKCNSNQTCCMFNLNINILEAHLNNKYRPKRKEN